MRPEMRPRALGLLALSSLIILGRLGATTGDSFQPHHTSKLALSLLANSGSQRRIFQVHSPNHSLSMVMNDDRSQ